MIRLGKRLEALDASIQNHYEHIWDCCCDHGLLGMNLVARKAAPTVHFVDVAPLLIKKVNIKLAEHFGTDTQSHVTWLTHCMDAASLNLDKYDGNQLVVIAGVGGDLTLSIINKLYDTLKVAGKLQNVDFLLCPIRQHYQLRCGLREKFFKVKNEILVEENRRIYEILLVTGNPNLNELADVTPTGEQIWIDENNPMVGTAQKYADSVLAHYSKRALTGKDLALETLQAYQKAIRLRIPD